MAHTTHISGELAGVTSATQMPTRACTLVCFRASSENAGKVYLGVAGVTKVNGSTDSTTGLQLAAGDSTGWLPCNGLSDFYRICDNTGDSLTYLAVET
jgi:hypothetical protein